MVTVAQLDSVALRYVGLVFYFSQAGGHLSDVFQVLLLDRARPVFVVDLMFQKSHDLKIGIWKITIFAISFAHLPNTDQLFPCCLA